MEERIEEAEAIPPVLWIVIDPKTGNLGLGTQPGVNPVILLLKALEYIELNRQAPKRNAK